MADPIISAQVITGDIQTRLQDLEKVLADLTPLYKEIGEVLLLQTDERFRREVDPSGIPWKPNTAYTLRLKKQQRRIMRILQSTGRMRASVSYQASREGVVAGTNVQYARLHQLGGRSGKFQIPIRRFLGVGPKDQDEILALVEEYFKRYTQG